MSKNPSASAKAVPVPQSKKDPPEVFFSESF